MDQALLQTRNEFDTSLSQIPTLSTLQHLETSYLGRKGIINDLAKQLISLSIDEKRTYGRMLNELKEYIIDKIESRKKTFNQKLKSNILESIDTSLPGTQFSIGQLHPTTRILRKINSFFRYLGYSVYEGPEIETEEYNFKKLNLPQDHPARELQDTLYIVEPEYLLRTHTSSVETRAMTIEKLPLRIVVPGKVYRNETANATNNAMFYQYEGLCVDQNISMAHLKGTLNEFVKFLYGDDTKTRFRCKYYPQVEPGAGMDIQCSFCGGVGCQVCKYRGWIEVLGAGMVHPNILSHCNIDPKKYTGFAFGMGLDRLVMLSNNIKDIRTLYNGQLIIKQKTL